MYVYIYIYIPVIFFDGISAADIKRNDSRPFQAIILDNWIFQKNTMGQQHGHFLLTPWISCSLGEMSSTKPPKTDTPAVGRLWSAHAPVVFQEDFKKLSERSAGAAGYKLENNCG